MEVTIVGVGCKRCDQLMANTREALDSLGHQDCPIERVENTDDIADMGVLLTPTLVVNNVLVAMGKVPSTAQLEKHIGLALKQG